VDFIQSELVIVFPSSLWNTDPNN